MILIFSQGGKAFAQFPFLFGPPNPFLLNSPLFMDSGFTFSPLPLLAHHRDLSYSQFSNRAFFFAAHHLRRMIGQKGLESFYWIPGLSIQSSFASSSVIIRIAVTARLLLIYINKIVKFII